MLLRVYFAGITMGCYSFPIKSLVDISNLYSILVCCCYYCCFIVVMSPSPLAQHLHLYVCHGFSKLFQEQVRILAKQGWSCNLGDLLYLCRHLSLLGFRCGQVGKECCMGFDGVLSSHCMSLYVIHQSSSSSFFLTPRSVLCLLFAFVAPLGSDPRDGHRLFRVCRSAVAVRSSPRRLGQARHSIRAHDCAAESRARGVASRSGQAHQALI